MNYEVEGVRPRGKSNKSQREILEKYYQTQQLKEDAMDVYVQWTTVIRTES